MSEFLGDYRLDPPSEDYPEPYYEAHDRPLFKLHDFVAMAGDDRCEVCGEEASHNIHQVSHPEDAVANQERPE